MRVQGSTRVSARRRTPPRPGERLARTLAALNARHPWSHNDHFHRWILAHLPDRRRRALDVGCGQGALVATLSAHFAEVHGNDIDATMRRAAQDRSAGLANVTIHDGAWAAAGGEFDLVTMVAVLHHLAVPDALRDVCRLLAPGGRFLAVGLAPPRSLRDHLWEAASVVTNPLIGLAKHPRPSRGGPQPDPFPVKDPTISYDELRHLLDEAMPGAAMRHRLGFRHSIAWTKPPT